jgi:NitT/TauT family transport system substrate-binding protein
MLSKFLNPLVGLIILVFSIVLWLQRDEIRQFLGGEVVVAEPLTVGTNVWPGYEPLYLARNLGYYNDSIRLAEYSSATEVLRAIRNKLIDVATLTLDEVLLLRQSGVDVRIVLVTDISNGGDVIVARPGIESLADLKGRKVGVESTALGAYVLTRALQKVGLTPADVQVVPIEVGSHYMAYTDNVMDAVVTFEPVRSQLLRDGAYLVFDSSQIPGEIVDVVVVREEVLAGKEEQIQGLISGWFKALTYLSVNPNEAGKRMAERLNLSPEEALASFEGLILPDPKGNLDMFDESQALSLIQTAKKLTTIMIEANLLDRSPSVLIAPQFVQDLRR